MKWFIDGYARIAIVLDLEPTCNLMLADML